MNEQPLPGTKAAIDAGCLCFRKAWQWDASKCIMHSPRLPEPELEPLPTGPGWCEHGERKWSCEECAERAASYKAYVADMRGLTYRRTNDFGAQP